MGSDESDVGTNGEVRAEVEGNVSSHSSPQPVAKRQAHEVQSGDEGMHPVPHPQTADGASKAPDDGQ